MDEGQKRALAEVVRAELQPLTAKVDRIERVLLEGDAQLEIPSLVKQVQAHGRRITRLEVAAAALALVLGVAIAADPEAAAAVARFIGLFRR